MSTERYEQTQSRQSGRTLELGPDQPEEKTVSRATKTFVPNQHEALADIPESITAGERLPHIDEYSGIQLESLPIKGLKSFVYSSLALLIAISGWEIWLTIKSALEIHWLFAGIFIFLLTLALVLGARVLLGYLKDSESNRVLDDIREQSARLLEGHDHGRAKDLITTLNVFYADKPQQVYFQRCMEQLPDYSDDREVIEHIDRVFLQALDKEALRRISRFSGQTGVAVAISPWASVDMGLALWRSIKMINEVSQVYGFRPSLTHRYSLLKAVINQLALIGVSEIVLEQTLEELGVSSLSGIASLRFGQGVGAGIYSAKIGLAAMHVSRPIGFTEQQKPRLKSLLVPIIASIKEILKR